jgi:hypothetical protein
MFLYAFGNKFVINLINLRSNTSAQLYNFAQLLINAIGNLLTLITNNNPVKTTPRIYSIKDILAVAIATWYNLYEIPENSREKALLFNRYIATRYSLGFAY